MRELGSYGAATITTADRQTGTKQQKVDEPRHSIREHELMEGQFLESIEEFDQLNTLRTNAIR